MHPDHSARKYLPRLTFWAAATFAFVMAVLPHPPRIFDLPDKVQHMIAFLVLAVLGRWAYPLLRKRRLLLGLALYGAVIEIVQGLPFVGRDRDLLDWLADVGASLAVFVIIALWNGWKERRIAV